MENYYLLLTKVYNLISKKSILRDYNIIKIFVSLWKPLQNDTRKKHT